MTAPAKPKGERAYAMENSKAPELIGRKPNPRDASAPAKHTPGPWRVRSGVAIDDARGRWIASAAKSSKDWITEGERQANAALIAAAPDMLAALRDVRDNVMADSPEMWARVDAAIAKATGGAS